MLADRQGAEINVAPLTDDGRIDEDALIALIGPQTKLVAIAHVSNVLGGVVDVVAVEPDDHGDDEADDDQLQCPLEHPDIPPERDPGAQGAGQRYGGE
jgi:hypothetical protein